MAASLQNRMRFPLEVFDAVRAAFPATSRSACGSPPPTGSRAAGISPQTIEFAQELKKRGVDWIDVSSGGVSPLQKIPLGPGYQVPLAQAVKEATGVTTIAVGLITEAKQAEDIVASGKADMVALARGMLFDPRWGWHAAAELGGEVARRRNTGARSPRRKRRCSARPRSGRGRFSLRHRRASHLAPLAGRGQRASCERVREDSPSTRKSRIVPLTRRLRCRSVSDLSPQAGRGLRSAKAANRTSRSRGALRPSFAINFPPSPMQRAQGNAGRPMRPIAACAMVVVERTRVSQVTPESPGIPHAMVYGL